MLFLTTKSFCQENKKIEIINANQTFANSNKHPEYWRLIGNVSFKHNNAIMRCDSAYHYTETEKVIAFGNIIINKGDSTSITGKKLTYFGEKNYAKVEGDVVLIDQHMTLNTQKFIYNLKDNIISFNHNGEVIQDNTIIKAERGIYHCDTYNIIFKNSVNIIGLNYNILTNNMHYNTKEEISKFYGPSNLFSGNKNIYYEYGWYNTKTKIAQLSNNIKIRSDNSLIKSDSLFFDNNTGYTKALNNVVLIDTIRDMIISGGIAENFEEDDRIIIKSKPLLEINLEEDTIFMHAKEFIKKQKKNKNIIIAYPSVKFYKKNFQGKCDSLSYNTHDSIIRMFKKPILWSENFQITADSLEFSIIRKEIRKLHSKENPIIINKEDSFEYNQISGKEMVTSFDNNKINKVNVLGNGESIFIVKDDTDNTIGLNYIKSSNLYLYFKKGEIENITYDNKPNSIVIPTQEIKEKERYLDDFIWREEERPNNKKDIFN